MSTFTSQHWSNIYSNKPVSSLSWTVDKISPVTSDLLKVAATSTPLRRIADLGGGASPFAAELVSQQLVSEKISVVDVSKEALAIAKKEFDNRVTLRGNTNVEWIVADVREFNKDGEYGQYNLVHDRAVYHFLTKKEDRLSYSQMLHKTLQPGGWLIIGTFALPGGPLKCSGLPVERYDSEKLKRELNIGYGDDSCTQTRWLELVESRNEIHFTPSGAEQKFTFCLFKDVQ